MSTTFVLGQGAVASVIATQYGAATTAILPFKALRGATFREGSTVENSENEGAPQRPTKHSRIKSMKADFKLLAKRLDPGVQIITEALHVHARVINKKFTYSVGGAVALDKLISSCTLEVIDGAGRWKTLNELTDEDERWGEQPLLVQFYLDLDQAQEVLLMENLNSKRATLEKNFHAYLRSSFFDASIRAGREDELSDDHIFAHLAFLFARRARGPWVNRIRFHDTEGPAKKWGIGIHSIAANIEKAESFAEWRLSDELQMADNPDGMTDTEIINVYGAVWDAIGASDDIIFGDNFHEWSPGASAMFQCLMSGGLRSAKAIYDQRGYIPREALLRAEICDKYGDVFRAFIAAEEKGIHRKNKGKFQEAGGAAGLSDLVKVFIHHIDKRTEELAG